MTSGAQSFDRLAEQYDRLAELGPGDIAKYLASALPERGRTALDVGCGSGRHALLLADRYESVLGVDLSAPMIELARRKRPRPNVTYEVADLMTLDHEPFDLLLCVGTLHHVPDLEAALAKIRSLVRPGGTAILVDLVSERGRLPKWFFRAGAVVDLGRDLLGRRPHALERFRLAMGPAWLDHLASDRYLSSSEFDRRYGASLPGSTIERVAQFRVCTWTAPPAA